MFNHDKCGNEPARYMIGGGGGGGGGGACYTPLLYRPYNGVCMIRGGLVTLITPRAHARARGYVIGRGVYYIYIYSYRPHPLIHFPH